jgi:hypothetical protein
MVIVMDSPILAHCSTQRASIAAFGEVGGDMPFAILAGDTDIEALQGAAVGCVLPASRPYHRESSLQITRYHVQWPIDASYYERSKHIYTS